MTQPTITAQQAIETSVMQNRIVTLEYDQTLADSLTVLCSDETEANGIHEYWGEDDRDSEWRVHLDARGLVEIEIMPDHLRSSHRTANNWGRYPHNGAERALVSHEEAMSIIQNDPDDYAHIVDQN